MIDLNLIALISLGLVVFIGLPHGALDGAVAVVSGYGKTRLQMVVFSVSYIAIAGAVLVLWMVTPVLSLMAFMTYSMIHFGLGDSDLETVDHKSLWQRLNPIIVMQVICHGGLVVVLIPFIHIDDVTPIFAILTGGQSLTGFWMFMHFLAVVFALSCFAYTIAALIRPQFRRRWIEFIILSLIITLLPPLAGFALYFCFVHTPRHVKTVIDAVKNILPNAKILPLTFGFTIVTWAGMIIAVLFLWGDITLSAAMIEVIFIGLAALTVPHMLLVDGVFRPNIAKVTTQE